MAADFTCHQCSRALTRSFRKPFTLLGAGGFVQNVGRRRNSTATRFATNTRLLSQLRARSSPIGRHLHPTISKAPISHAAAEASSASHLLSSTTDYSRVLLGPDNLFHSYSNSPSPLIRRRAEYIKQTALCPHPRHKYGGLQGKPVYVNFECPDCGIPVYCDEEHWADDFETHIKVCHILRQINEDDHDLVSGRFFPEFDYPGPQEDELVVNMTNWDTFMYTREFNAVNNDRSMRQLTKLLTYPLTISSVLHELSPYHIRSGGRLTAEGLKSLSALRYTLHPLKAGEDSDIAGLRLKSPPVRIFVLGARAESSLPREVWLQTAHLFPRSLINIIFIGPESMTNRDDEFPLPERTPNNPFGAIVEDRLGGQMKITTYVDYFHTMYNANYFQPFDPYFDCFMLYHPQLGNPATSHEWMETLPQLLETKVPIICTGYNDQDMQRDLSWMMNRCGGEVDLLLEPGENIFRSLRWELNDANPHDVTSANWGLWAFRGKRYEATYRDPE
ncbi:translational activator for mitochondrial COX1 [Ascosphaera aggregata]|nr:translational activator for mitochondrial COX1 [Ascosphaera aggregata]